MEQHKKTIRINFSAEALDDGSYTLGGPFGGRDAHIKTHKSSREEVTRDIQLKMDEILSQLK